MNLSALDISGCVLNNVDRTLYPQCWREVLSKITDTQASKNKTCTCSDASHDQKGLDRFNEAAAPDRENNLLYSGPMLRKIPRPLI